MAMKNNSKLSFIIPALGEVDHCWLKFYDLKFPANKE